MDIVLFAQSRVLEEDLDIVLPSPWISFAYASRILVKPFNVKDLIFNITCKRIWVLPKYLWSSPRPISIS